MTTSHIDWSLLEATLKQRARVFLSALYPPAQTTELDALRAMGAHPSVIESYERHDGSRRHGGLLSAMSVPPEQIWVRRARWQRVRDALSETQRIASRISLPRGWLVIARYGRHEPRDDFEGDDLSYLMLVSGEAQLLTLGPAKDWSSPVPTIPLGLSWIDALASVQRALSSGWRGEREEDVDRLVEVTHKTPSVRPLVGSVGQRLLTLLTERGALVLCSEPTTDLITRLEKALRRRERGAAARDVAAALRASSQVHSFALTEDQLAAFLEVF